MRSSPQIPGIQKLSSQIPDSPVQVFQGVPVSNSDVQYVNYSLEYADTLRRFHLDNESFVRAIMGPFGSGKSTACCMEILLRAWQQRPNAMDGRRYTRWAVIRNSYPELKSTTIKTWLDWCPSQYGRLTMSSPIKHHIRTAHLDIEILFLALDKAEDVKKLLSMELTGAWLNEVREIPKSIFDAVTGRVGRFPSAGKEGCTWSGVIMDTNPPDDQSWYFRLAEDERPEGFTFYRQPGGRAPNAENLPNLPPNYYQRLSAGKDPDWVKVYVDGEYGFVAEGKPVFPMYRDRVHTANEVIVPVDSRELLLGVDFGLTPAMAMGQKLFDGRWLIVDEICTEDFGIPRFAELASSYCAQNYDGFAIGGGWGDPAGTSRDYRESTAFELMNEYFPLDRWHSQWREAPSNDWEMRKAVVEQTLSRMVDGEPGILISPKCKMLRKGFVSGYHYRYVGMQKTDVLQERPVKNRFSHIHDALQMLLLGGGEHDVVLRKVDRKRDIRKLKGAAKVASGTNYDVLNYKG